MREEETHSIPEKPVERNIGTGSPPVSIIMPVYNSEKYIRDTIDSVLTQDYDHFEFIIINDGSTDSSVGIIESYTDKRIRLLHNDGNRGLVFSLNRAIDEARAPYIARIDADDIAFPQRIKLQAAFLDNNPEVGLCGTWYENMGDKTGPVRLETEHNEIVFRLLYQFHMLHPSWMFRKEVLQKNLIRYEVLYGEDYDLVTRLVAHTRIANLPVHLMKYRQFSESMSKKNHHLTVENCMRIKQQLFRRMGVDVTREEVVLFEELMHQDYRAEKEYLGQVEQLLLKMHHANRQSHLFPEAFLDQKLTAIWFHACTNASSLGPRAFYIYKKSELSSIHNTIGYGPQLKLLVKSALFV